MRSDLSRFLPATRAEMDTLGWDRCEIVLVSGDAYVDSPYMGVTLVGRVLRAAGFRVGIIAQPELHDNKDIARLGEPSLFWGISGGSVDSMVANYTASGKKRKKDDFTPGGNNCKRPDRAVISYANLIRRFFKNTCPIVLGGIEASLRRPAHYDAWSNTIRRSILLDAKADYLLYGMADETVVDFARGLHNKKDITRIRGLCFVSQRCPEGFLALPSYEACRDSTRSFAAMFRLFHDNCDPVTARGLAQQHGNRWLVMNPPPLPLETEALDRVHGLEFTHDPHPVHAAAGPIRALETIRFSIPTHRGCYGECSFCAISMHQGRRVTWRSIASLVEEARRLTRHARFKGMIHDLGGPTANMYGFECEKKRTHGSCVNRRCLLPSVCPNLSVDHGPQITLLKEMQKIKEIRKVCVASGVRHDLVLADAQSGLAYLKRLVTDHLSGQMKVAPEHSEAHVLQLMGKPGPEGLQRFKKIFDTLTGQAGKKQFLTYYLIAAHPGCTTADMLALRSHALRQWRLLPEQVQIFTPTPSTWSTLMYLTGKNPWTDEVIFVERSQSGKISQKKILQQRTTLKNKG